MASQQSDWPAICRLEHQLANNTNLVHLHGGLDLIIENQFSQDNLHLEHGKLLANTIPGAGTEWDVSKRVALECILWGESFRIKHLGLGIVFGIVVQGVNEDGARAPLR